MTDILFRLEVDESGAVQGFRISRDELAKLEAATTGTGTAARRSSQDVRRFGDETQRAGQRAERSSRHFDRLRHIVAGVFTIATVRQAVRYADTMLNLEARLRIVTDTQDEFNIAQQETFAISQRTSTALEATTELYARLELSLKGMNVAQRDVLKVTETINKAMVVSGASTQEATSAIIQLSQGFAAGALRGDEFRSVAEQSPRILQALTAALGITRGELRALANDGKLTTEIIVAALLQQSETIDEEFGELPITVGRAFQQLRNEVLIYVGDTDEATGATRFLSEAILDLADNIETLANVSLAIGAASLTGFTAKALTSGRAIGFIATAARALVGPIGLVATAVGLVTFEFLEMKSAQDETTASTRDLIDAMRDAESAFDIRSAIKGARDELEEFRETQKALEEEFFALEDKQASGFRQLFSGGIFGTTDEEIQAEKERILVALDAIEAKIADYEANIEGATDRLGELGDAHGKTAEEIRAMLGATDKVSDEVKEYAAALKAAESAILSHGTAEQRIALIVKQHEEELVALTIALSTTAEGVRLLEQVEESIARQRDEAIEKVKDETDAVRIFEAAMDDLQQTVVDTAEQGFLLMELRLEELESQFLITAEQADEYRERLLLLRLASEQLAQDGEEDADAFTQAWERGIERMDDLFADLWRNLISGSEDAFESIQDFFENWLAEMAHAAITRPIQVQFEQALSGQGGGGGFLSSIGSLFGAGGGAGQGASGSAGSAAGVGFAGIPVVGWILAGMALSDTLFQQGFQVGGDGLDTKGQLLTHAVWGQHALIADKLLRSLGISDRIAGVLSGSPVFAALFGHKRPEVESQGLRGTFDLEGVVGELFFNIIAEGGLFRSDKRWEEVLGFDEELQAFFDDILGTITGFSTELADMVGIDLETALSGFSQAFELTLDPDPEIAEQQIQDLAEQMGLDLLSAVSNVFGEGVQRFVTGAEDIDAGLVRLTIAAETIKALADDPRLEGLEFDTLLSVAEQVNNFGEDLALTFVGVLASVEVLYAAFDTLGLTLDLTRESTILLAAEFAEAAGGLDRAAALWANYFDVFFDADELLEARVNQARRAAGAALGDIGLDLSVDKDQFRTLFEAILPTLSAEALAEWLEAAEALGVVISLEEELIAVRREGLTLNAALEDQIDLVARLREEFDGSTASHRALVSEVGNLADLMDELRDAFAATRDAVDDIIGSAITQLRRETLTDEELFNELRSEALAQANLIGTATSNEEILALVQGIRDLTLDARSLIDSPELNQQFIAFLENVQNAANLRLGELEEEAIAKAQAEIDQFEAMVAFNDSMVVFQEAVQVFAGAAGAEGEGLAIDEEGLQQSVRDGMIEGFEPFDSEGLQGALGAFADGVSSFHSGVSAFQAVAATINTTPPSVTVNVSVDASTGEVQVKQGGGEIGLT